MKLINKLYWLWNRLRCMSLAEIGYRFYQKGHNGLQKLGLLTASRPPMPNLKVPGSVWLPRPEGIAPNWYAAMADRIVAGKLRVFAVDYEFAGVPQWNYDASSGKATPLSFGKSSDYRDLDRFGDIKYVWEPSRHLHLLTLAQALALTGNFQYGDALRRHLSSWFDQCPYLMGAQWASSLEVGIRLINWSWVWQLTGGLDSPLLAGSEGQQFKARWLDSIYQHCHFIAGHWSKHSSANNHLLGEAAGLLVASITWPYWPESAGWRAQAQAVLATEALMQNDDDGVNKEQAVSYQQFVFDFLLYAGLAARAGGQDFPPAYWQRLESMLDFVASIMDVGGHVPMIGDADDGYVSQWSQAADFCPYRSLLATGAVLFKRGDFKAKAGGFDDKSRWLLGSQGEQIFNGLAADCKALPVRDAFPQGGYYILGSDFETASEIRMLVDAGPLGYLSIAAHGHADALALTLSVGGREFLIDPGTYAYHNQKQWRDYFRGTSAHNTVRIDGVDQSASGGNFMWLSHARAECLDWRNSADETVFCGRHDGYQRLADPVTHSRTIRLDKRRQEFLITDTLTCQQRHTVERFWHFSEHCTVSVDDDGTITAEQEGCRVVVKPMQAVLAEVYRGAETTLLGWVSRNYDVKTPTTAVAWRNEIHGASEFGALIECKLS